VGVVTNDYAFYKEITMKNVKLVYPCAHAATLFAKYLRGGYRLDFPTLFLGYQFGYYSRENVWEGQDKKYIFTVYYRNPNIDHSQEIFYIEPEEIFYQFTEKDFEEINKFFENMSRLLKRQYSKEADFNSGEKLVQATRNEFIYRQMQLAGFYLLGKFTISSNANQFTSELTLDSIICPTRIVKYPASTFYEFEFGEPNVSNTPLIINRSFIDTDFIPEPYDLFLAFPDDYQKIKTLAENIFESFNSWIRVLNNDKLSGKEIIDLYKSIGMVSIPEINRFYPDAEVSKEVTKEPVVEELIKSKKVLSLITYWNNGLSTYEISKKMGVTERTVNNEKSKARLVLKKNNLNPDIYIHRRRIFGKASKRVSNTHFGQQ